ncbi:MAG: N-acetylmuramoyl-L-alanine amidase [Oscillospiraceae bacterium]
MNHVRWKPLLFLGILFCVLIVAYWDLYRPFSVVTFSSVRMGGVAVIIDAGHGGEDGGAVSPSGTVESGINLSIACKLDDLLHFYGVPTVMVRREDISLHDTSADTIREKKRSDLKRRVQLVNETENGVLISIHQNIYSSSKLAGAQVFYADEASSLEWAVQTQECLRQTLNPKNKRQAAKIPDSIYLMKHCTRPAILIECGFLSNAKEESQLLQDTYQTKIAAALAASTLVYYGAS